MSRLVMWRGILLFVLMAVVHAELDAVKPKAEQWSCDGIGKYFEIPDTSVYRGIADSLKLYKSPLVRFDGTVINNTEAWSRERENIRERWLGVTGRMPEIISGEPLAVLDSVCCEEYMRYTVVLKWLPNDTAHAILLVPHEREVPAPAVVTVFYEPQTSAGLGGNPNRDFARQLACEGFVTLSIGTTRTTVDRTYSLYYPDMENSESQPLILLAYAAANAYEALAMDRRVDKGRIGIMGHSYGGKWAMFASCLYDKWACACWSDPGIVFDETKGGNVNYWEPWYLGYEKGKRTTKWDVNGYKHPRGAYKIIREKGMDLHELHALMCPRPFMVSGGEADDYSRWAALIRSVEVNRMLGYENRVGMTNRLTHAPTVESNAQVISFFNTFLK